MKSISPPKIIAKTLLLIGITAMSLSLQAAEFNLFTLSTTKGTISPNTAEARIFFDSGIPISTLLNSNIRLASIGDEILIPTPSGKTYLIKVKKLTQHKNGDISLAGRVNERYHAMLTHGKVGTYASINTPGGEYKIDIQAGKEWLLTPEHLELPTPIPFEDDAIIPRFIGTDKQNNSNNNQPLTPTSQADTDGIATIDIMVLYTPELVAERGGIDAVESRINHIVNLTNQAYIDSQMLIAIRLVHSAEINANNDNDSSTSLDNLKDGVGIFSDVETLRENKGADLVVLLRNFVSAHDSCGVAYLLGDRETGTIPQSHREAGYGIVHDGENALRRFCTEATFAHELGHNFGFAHDRAHSGGSGLFSYSYGYDVPEKFATIMSYGRPEINKFSNPDIFCNAGYCDGDEPLGVLDGKNSANNAKSGNNIRFDIASFYEEKAPVADIRIPDVGNQTEETARATLEALGLVVSITYQKTGEDTPRGYVISQDPASETLVVSGSTVNLIVSDGIILPTNLAPEVDAGSDQTIVLPNGAPLAGTVSDDGYPNLPSAELTSLWTKKSGPGNVSFENDKLTETLATFSAGGNYILKLTASDTDLTSSDEISITVNIKQTITGYIATPTSGVVGDTAVLSVTKSGDSDNPVIFKSSTPSICTVKGSTLTMLAAGECTVTANQLGDDTYIPANQVSLNITVNKINQAKINPDCNGDNDVSILDIVCVINAVLTEK